MIKNENGLFIILRDVVKRINNELLLAAIVAFIFIVFYPDCGFWIALVYLIGALIYALIEILNKKEANNYLEEFNNLIEDSSWRREIIDNKEVYFCDKNNSYQIEIGLKIEDFTEEWTQVYPDKRGSWRSSVYLKFQGVVIKEIPFISCDGGRIFVPLPERLIENGVRSFQYKEDSLEYKLAKVIGEFYIYETIERVCEMSRIKIIK